MVLTDHEYTILALLRPRKDGDDVRFAVHERYPFELAQQGTEMDMTRLPIPWYCLLLTTSDLQTHRNHVHRKGRRSSQKDIEPETECVITCRKHAVTIE